MICGSLYLRLDGRNSSLDRRLEESRDLLSGSQKVKIRGDHTKPRLKSLPREFELATTDASREILIQRRPERNKLKLLVIAEETFGSLVETLSNMVKGVRGTILRALELLYMRECGVNDKETNSWCERVPSKNARARLLTNTEPAKTPEGLRSA